MLWLYSVGDEHRGWKPQVLQEKPVPLTFCPPQIPYGLTWDRILASAVKGQGLSQPWHTIVINVYRIWGFNDEEVLCHGIVCSLLWSGRMMVVFRKNILLPSSGLKFTFVILRIIWHARVLLYARYTSHITKNENFDNPCTDQNKPALTRTMQLTSTILCIFR